MMSRGHQGVGAVAQHSGHAVHGRGRERAFDLARSHVAAKHGGQVGQRAVLHRHPDGYAVEPGLLGRQAQRRAALS